MTEIADHLIAVSQIAIAMAGFAGLASVFGGRQRETLSREGVRTRFKVMLVLSLYAVLLPFVPLALLAYGLDEELAWKGSCVVFLISLIAYSAYYFARDTDRITTREQVGLGSWVLGAILYFGPYPLLISGVVGFGSADAHYFAALLLILLFSALMFFRLVLALIVDDGAA